MKASFKNMYFVCLFICLISYTSPVFAYLDPGTGSILLQGLIGGIAVVMSFLSLYWFKVKAFFVKKEDQTDIEKDTGNNE